MTNDLAPTPNAGWLSSLMNEGGALGMLVGKPAATAIGRLVSGLTDIPAAGLENIAQRIRDDTAGRTAVSQALGKAAAEQAITNPALVERALIRWTGQQARKQENLEAVAEKTVELLQEAAAEESDEGPSDDFMNHFESHAAKASSEEMRELFARVLAGECRRPGSFSLGALQVLSVMDQPLAAAVQEARDWVIDDEWFYYGGSFSQGARLRTLFLLSDFGLVRLGMFNRRITLPDDGKLAMRVGGLAFILSSEPRRLLEITAAFATPVGQQIFGLAPPRVNRESAREIATMFNDHGMKSILFGEIAARIDGRIHLHRTEELAPAR